MAAWQQWQGRVINGRFSLHQYLGGSEKSAVYLTEINGSKAAIKLIPAAAAYAQVQASQWELARKLSHPHLVRILETGRHADNRKIRLPNRGSGPARPAPPKLGNRHISDLVLLGSGHMCQLTAAAAMANVIRVKCN